MANSTQNGPQQDPWHQIRTFPVPDFDGDYCDTTVTDCGHIQMMSDTPGQEFILTNHANGTYMMMLPDGSQQDEVHGDYIQVIYNNGKLWIKGSSVVSIEGNANINVGKNAYIGVDGDMTTHVKGNVDLTSDTQISLNAPTVNLNTTTGVTLSGSEMSFPSDVTIHGDLNVQQGIVAQGNIQSLGAVKAECGLLTLGSLIVGPLAETIPLPTLLTSFVMIDVATASSIQVGGMFNIQTLGDVNIDAGGAVDIAAAGVVGIQGSFVNITPDVGIGDVVSFLSHIHYGVTPGPSATSVPFPGS